MDTEKASKLVWVTFGIACLSASLNLSKANDSSSRAAKHCDFKKDTIQMDVLQGSVVNLQNEWNLAVQDTFDGRRTAILENISLFDGEPSRIHRVRDHFFSNSVFCMGRGAKNNASEYWENAPFEHTSSSFKDGSTTPPSSSSPPSPSLSPSHLLPSHHHHHQAQTGCALLFCVGNRCAWLILAGDHLRVVSPSDAESGGCVRGIVTNSRPSAWPLPRSRTTSALRRQTKARAGEEGARGARRATATEAPSSPARALQS